MDKTNDVNKMTERAALFDACVAELPADTQKALNDLAMWVAKNVMTKGGGLMSAKELIVQSLRFEEVLENFPNMRQS